MGEERAFEGPSNRRKVTRLVPKRWDYREKNLEPDVGSNRSRASFHAAAS
jgi:hypothetical protein